MIEGNLIEDSRWAVKLWWDEDEKFLNSIYGKKNRTDSADTVVRGNVIRRAEAALVEGLEAGLDAARAGNRAGDVADAGEVEARQ